MKSVIKNLIYKPVMKQKNSAIKKIFVCEFITAGGFNHAESRKRLPKSLLTEAAMMRDALLTDLAKLDYHITITLDSRLSPPENCDDCVLVDSTDDIWTIWEAQIQLADAVWIIAPETNGYLKKLTNLVAKHKVIALGCGPKAIEIFSSKLATFLICERSGIHTISTYTFDNMLVLNSKCLAKPDDGAGCDDILCFENSTELSNWIMQNNKQQSHVIQPYIDGVCSSISCVMLSGTAFVLSCNKQLVTSINNQLGFNGLTLNAMQDYWVAFDVLAQQLAQLMPDLQGFVGIDVIVQNQKVLLVEVNPRLTTAYVGLRQATGLNVAELVIKALTNTPFTWPTIERNVIDIYV